MIALLLVICIIIYAVAHGYWGYLIFGMALTIFAFYMNATHPLNKTDRIPDSYCVNRCPKCHSPYVFPTSRGFSLLQSILGGAILGHVGYLSGFIGSGSRRFQCIHCGNVYKYFGFSAVSDRIIQKERLLQDLMIRQKFGIKE